MTQILQPLRQSLSTYEGWRAYAEKPPRERPGVLSRSQLDDLSDRKRAIYDRDRRTWHANLIFRTRQVDFLHTELGDLVDSNMQDADNVKGAAAIDAPPTLGKSTVLKTFGRSYHVRRLVEDGEYVDAEQTIRHIPVCHIMLTGKVTIKGLHEMLLTYYAHPAAGPTRATVSGRDLARAAAESVARHDTRLILIDDLHFLNMRTRDGVEVANQLKWLANEYDATFLFAGVALRERGLIGEGLSGRDAAMAQTFRRWTVMGMTSHAWSTGDAREEWTRLIRNIENAVVLADMPTGMLVDIRKYLFARTGGNIGSLMALIRRGTARAIRTGTERMDQALLDTIRLDEGAETDRRHLEEKLGVTRTRGGAR